MQFVDPAMINYYELYCDIGKQAVLDYRKVYRKFLERQYYFIYDWEDDHYNKTIEEKVELEKFFKSKAFAEMSGLNGKEVIKIIQLQENEKWKKRQALLRN